MKAWIAGCALLAGALLVPEWAMGADNAKAAVPTTPLFLNGLPLTPEVPARNVNGTVLVPVRIIAESIGSKVEWDGPNRKVVITRDAVKIVLTIDKKEVVANGKTTTLDEAPVIVDGSTMLPLRYVSEQLGVKVTWDELVGAVYLYKKAEPAGGSAIASAATAGGAAGAGSTAGTSNNTTTGTGAASAAGGTAGTKGTDSGKTNTAGSSGSSTAADGGSGSLSATSSTGRPAAAGTAQGAGGKGTATASGSTNTADKPAKAPSASAAEPDPDLKPGTISAIDFSNDRLTITTKSVTTKPNTFTLTNPDRFVVDLPYSELDAGLKAKLTGSVGEIALDHPVAQRIRFSNYSSEPSTVRIIIDLKARAALTAVDPKTLPANQIAFDMKEIKPIIVIDAGHGDHDGGAVSLTGKTEKTFNLAMAKKVEAILKTNPKVEVLMTRSDDTFVELNDRVDFANSHQADVFVSIHGNKLPGKPAIRGSETYYYNEQSLNLAKALHQSILTSAGFPDRGVRKNDFRVVKYTTMPAVLLEIGYLSNKTDENNMFDEAFQNRVAASIAQTILDYLNIK
ncbi:N-acetylmuramoyl-L-alanine amidase [Paenibacillus chartarius]|uniref:N-acetylmuramoyl-L-alanine amidase n=1 Tax=Paenibacillus chartarius TaxID=747481 RepID=A0ABV6DQ54_9BACL